MRCRRRGVIRCATVVLEDKSVTKKSVWSSILSMVNGSLSRIPSNHSGDLSWRKLVESP